MYWFKKMVNRVIEFFKPVDCAPYRLYGPEIAVLYEALNQFTEHYLETGDLEQSRSIAVSRAASLLYRQFPDHDFEVVAEGDGHTYIRPPKTLMPLFLTLRSSLDLHIEFLKQYKNLTDSLSSQEATTLDGK